MPTRDISVIWSADLLRPQVGHILNHNEAEEAATAWFDHQHHRLLQSGALFERVTGRKWRAWLKYESGAKTTPALQRFDADASGVISVAERKQALDEWQKAYETTAAEWEGKYRGQYRVAPGMMPSAAPSLKLSARAQELLSSSIGGLFTTSGQGGDAESGMDTSQLAEQLADAVASQASFVGRILALGPNIVDDAWIDRAVTRYGQFLLLAKQNPGKTLVPTLDVDLIWHVHMLSPLDYRDDCHTLLGRLLYHDDQMAEGSIAAAFENTKAMWHEAHGTPYVWSPPPHAQNGQKEAKKRKEADGAGSCGGYSGCGSCGWGDEAFHLTLQHGGVEAAEVQEAYAGDASATDSALGLAESANSTDGESLSPSEGMPESAPWAHDAPPSPDEQRIDDPWAAPENFSSSSEQRMEDSWSSTWSSSSSNSSSDSGGWGWGGDSGGDSGGDGSGCGGGCGGD